MGINHAESATRNGPPAAKSKHGVLPDPDVPEIPPRMKKQGPELPEKPPHLRLTNLTKAAPVPSSQKKEAPTTASAGKTASAENSQSLFLTNARKKGDREVLIAATKGTRERPAEKRQREPAKLLIPTSKPFQEPIESSLPVLLGLSSPGTPRKNAASTMKLEPYRPNPASKLVNLKHRNARQPVILIPRSQLDTRSLHHIWNSYPISYSVWVQNSGSGDPQVTSRLVKKAFSPNGGSTVELRPGVLLSASKGAKAPSHEPRETKIFVSGKKSFPASGTSAKPRSSSVTRSGSLTSHGSTSSDSGNETAPKSVLKKHRRESNSLSSCSKSAEHKKNVTFNAFATVQLMEE